MMGLYTYLFMTSEKGLIFINVLQNKNVNPEPACLWMFFFLHFYIHICYDWSYSLSNLIFLLTRSVDSSSNGVVEESSL